MIISIHADTVRVTHTRESPIERSVAIRNVSLLSMFFSIRPGLRAPKRREFGNAAIAVVDMRADSIRS